MTPEILRYRYSKLDHCEEFDFSDVAKFFFLLDGHGSRTHSLLHKYANDPARPSCTCIGVPYGTDLLLVGNSVEQSSALNISPTKAKKEIVN